MLISTRVQAQVRIVTLGLLLAWALLPFMTIFNREYTEQPVPHVVLPASVEGVPASVERFPAPDA